MNVVAMVLPVLLHPLETLPRFRQKCLQGHVQFRQKHFFTRHFELFYRQRRLPDCRKKAWRRYLGDLPFCLYDSACHSQGIQHDPDAGPLSGAFEDPGRQGKVQKGLFKVHITRLTGEFSRLHGDDGYGGSFYHGSLRPKMGSRHHTVQDSVFFRYGKAILTSMGAIYKSKGRPDIELKWNIFFFPVIVVCVYIGSLLRAHRGGHRHDGHQLSAFLYIWRALHLAEISIKSFLNALKIAMTGTGLMVLSVYCFNRFYLSQYDYTHILSLSILTAVGVTVYGGYLLLFARENIFELMDMVKKGLRKN